jgi:hypothetical protein
MGRSHILFGKKRLFDFFITLNKFLFALLDIKYFMKHYL